MAITYNRTNWRAGKEGGTAWTPERLNNIENGIEQATNQINQNSSDIENINTNINEINTDIGEINSNLSNFIFEDLGDIRGNNNELNTRILNAFDNMENNSIKLFKVKDSTGGSIAEGGILTVIMFKSHSQYAPILGLRYDNVDGSIYIGSIYNSVFTGFTKLLH